jgi:hypothetical protein
MVRIHNRDCEHFEKRELSSGGKEYGTKLSLSFLCLIWRSFTRGEEEEQRRN